MSLNRARSLADLGRCADALHELRPSLGDASAGAEEWCLLARIQLGLRDPARAQRAAEQAIQREPGDEYGYRLRAIALMRQQNWYEAHRSILMAAQVDPDDPHVLAVLANVLLGQDRGKDAEAVVQQSLAVNPDQVAAWHSAASVANHRREFALAEERSRRGLALDPADTDLMLELSEAVARQGRHTEAAGYAKAAIAENPADQRGRAHLEATPRRIAAGLAILVAGGAAAAGVFWAVYSLLGLIEAPDVVRLAVAGAAAYGTGAVLLKVLLTQSRRRLSAATTRSQR